MTITTVDEKSLIIPDGAWGAAEELTADDFCISRILVTQPLSKNVLDGIASIGELRDSLTNELLAKQNQYYEVLVFDRWLNWVILKNKEYVKSVPVTTENTQDPWEEHIGEDIIQRTKTMNFYCLPIADGKGAIPKVLSLRKTGFRTGQLLQMQFAKLAAGEGFRDDDKKAPKVKKARPSAAIVVGLTPIKQTKKEYTFFNCDFKVIREATSEEMSNAFFWYQKLKKAKNVIIDSMGVDDELEHEVGVSAGNSVNPVIVGDDDIPF